MFNDDMPLKIAHTFGLNSFYCGVQVIQDSDGHILDEIVIDAYWFAQMEYFDPRRKFYIAVVHHTKGIRGNLLIPPISSSDEREFVGPSRPNSIDLSGWEDPVVSALQTVNMAYFDGMTSLRSDGLHCSLRVGTDSSEAILSFYGPSRNKSLKEVWHSILHATYHLVDLYDDEDMHKFIDQNPRIAGE
jgi:hypothetical protein